MRTDARVVGCVDGGIGGRVGGRRGSGRGDGCGRERRPKGRVEKAKKSTRSVVGVAHSRRVISKWLDCGTEISGLLQPHQQQRFLHTRSDPCFVLSWGPRAPIKVPNARTMHSCRASATAPSRPSLQACLVRDSLLSGTSFRPLGATRAVSAPQRVWSLRICSVSGPCGSARVCLYTL